MSAKNYAGFNYNGGSQYVAPSAGAVSSGYNAVTAQSTYPIIPNAGYGNDYQNSGGYTAAGTPNSSTAPYGYDYSQTYYQQAAGNYCATPPTPTVSKTHYSSPPVKNVNAGASKAGGKNKLNGTGKTGPTPPTAPPPTLGYVNYDAIYSAASLYVQQQQQQQAGKGVNNTGYGSNWSQFKGGRRNTGGNRGGDATKSRLHYCEVCKISCAGPQSYREHLDGQKHKKREAASKMQATAQATQNKGNNQHCELCDVTCTGNDAYAAHVRGSKHQRVLKLHQKLGKPIPADEPKKIEFIPEKPKEAATKVSGEVATKGAGGNSENDNDPSANIKPVGGEYIEEIKDDEGKMISFNCKLCECKFNDPNAKEMHMKGRRHRLQYKRKVQPDLVVDFKPTPRQRFLAEARAQRALLQSQRGNGNRGYYQELEGGMFWDEQQRSGQYGGNDYGMWPPRGFVGPQRGGGFGGRTGGNGPPSFFGMMPGSPGARRPESTDDRHAIARHAEIYPKEEELQMIQRIVSHTERALKFVSDSLADNPEDAAPSIKKEKPDVGQAKDGRDNQMFSFQKETEGSNGRILKGVMRVGFLAKGLLLHGDNVVELVVLCAEKPTVGLLKRVAAELPGKLKEVAGDQSPIEYRVKMDLDEAGIIVSDGSVTVTICLTSPILREVEEISKTETINEDSGNATLLPLAPCLQALAELRRAKWFQARATGQQSCVMTIRLLRDICHRVPSWQTLPQWSLELIVEKVISSAGFSLSPGECLRRIMEALATGLLINGPGIADPCEKEAQDSLVELGKQHREDLTLVSQQFLRFIAFRKIHKVLGMEQLPSMKFPLRPWQLNRKRVRESGNGGISGDKNDVDEKARDVKVAKV